MRQAGILAAAGSWALAHHVDRLTEDHENARNFAQRIGASGSTRMRAVTHLGVDKPGVDEAGELLSELLAR